MRYLSFAVCVAFVMFLFNGCGDDDDDDNDAVPTTGSVSGTVTFAGEPPEGEIEVQVSIFSVVGAGGMPAGPPDHYSEPFTEFTGQVAYKISGVSFGTYKLVAIGYEPVGAPPGTPETSLGIHGFSPPGDMEPDAVTVSEEQPDVTGIDIMASYAAAQQPR